MKAAESDFSNNRIAVKLQVVVAVVVDAAVVAVHNFQRNFHI